MVELLTQGEKIVLQSYLRLTDFVLWSLIEQWQFHLDPVLSDLSKRVITRRLLKTMPLDTSKFLESQALVEKARRLTGEIYGAENIDYYVMTDEPSRTSYKGYDWRPDTPDELIWLIGGDREPCPLEDEEENAIVRAFKVRKHFQRLVLPGEIRDRLKNI